MSEKLFRRDLQTCLIFISSWCPSCLLLREHSGVSWTFLQIWKLKPPDAREDPFSCSHNIISSEIHWTHSFDVLTEQPHSMITPPLCFTARLFIRMWILFISVLSFFVSVLHYFRKTRASPITAIVNNDNILHSHCQSSFLFKSFA